jgi:uncharacterized protein (TIGR02145 family)
MKAINLPNSNHMKKKLLLLFILALTISGQAQQSFSFTFSGRDNLSYTQLDSITIVNQTQSCDTILYWPDTMLNLLYVGLPEFKEHISDLMVNQNRPNPVENETSVSVFVPQQQTISLAVTDLMGREVISETYFLAKGMHSFTFVPGGSKLYIFTASGKTSRSSIKIVSKNMKNQTAYLEYAGYQHESGVHKSVKRIEEFVFSPGDDLLINGYADTLVSGNILSPETSFEYIFQFAFNIPCPGVPTISYEGITYNTVQIFNQCWLKENLNVGTMISGSSEMEDNQIIEKYCYNNDPVNCDEYGGLYQWDEVMQYQNDPGVQGICPEGWHIPTDDEWNILEGAADSYFGVGDTTWNATTYRGYDAGLNLKSAAGWNNNANGTDLFGFKATPGGIRLNPELFNGLLFRGYWWTSNEDSSSDTWRHYFAFNFDSAGRSPYLKTCGKSVRCIKD